MKILPRFILITTPLIYHADVMAGLANSNWLLTTHTTIALPKLADGTEIKCTDILNGYEFASFASDSSYFSSEWLNKLYFYSSSSAASSSKKSELSGQWSNNNNHYMMSYDPFRLNYSSTSTNTSLTGFFSRTNECVSAILGSQNNPAIIDSEKVLSYFDSGQLLNNGKRIKGSKKITLQVHWHNSALQSYQSTVLVSQAYSGIPDTLSSTCCDNNMVTNKIASDRFLADVDKLPAIQKNPTTGLRYLVLQEGRKNGTSPSSLTDKVSINSRTFYPSGTLFDSSNANAFYLAGSKITGLASGLKLMKPGDKYRFFMPSDLAYGNDGTKDSSGNVVIKPAAALIYDVELLSVTVGAPYNLTSACCGNDAAQNAIDSALFLEAVDKQPGIQKTASGLRYLVLQNGSGASPTVDDKVSVNYHGFYPSGKTFDSNSNSSFSLTGVIKGWTEGLQLMKVGSKFRFFIPADLAYGETGNASVKGNSALVFDVELLSVTPATTQN